MVMKTIPTTSIGTGVTLIYSITTGRVATIKQLSFTNAAGENRTVHIYDSSSATGSDREIFRTIIYPNETFIPAEVMNRKARLGYITAKTDEGTEVSVDGYLDEE
jgi:hypothetical protein